MTWIVAFIAKWRSTLIGLLGVLAVAGIGAAAFSAVIISGKNDVIELQAETNKQWAANFSLMKKREESSQKAVLELQASLDELAIGAAADAEAIKRLENTNEEVRNLLGTRLPPDLARMLNKK